MKNAICIWALLFVSSILFAQTPPPPNGKKWTRVNELSDEFNQSSINGSKWDDFHPHWNGRAPSRFKKGNAFVEGGFLKLRSTLLKDPNSVGDKFKDIWVNSAACVSKQKSARPGYYYEARIKASSLSMTSAFWFRVGAFSEIDVIEHIGDPSNNSRDNTLPFEFGTNTHYYGSQAGPAPRGSKWRMPGRGRDNFYVYGFWWKSPTELLFYHNGRQVMRVTPAVPLNENLKMIFDTEVFPFATAGVANIGLPLVSNLNNNSKNTMLVDWVRTYKLENGSSPAPSPVPTDGKDGSSATQYQYDVGTNSSVVWPGYTRLSNTTRPGSFGWANTNDIGSRDRGAASGRNNINRDINFSRETRFFTQNLSNGNWNVLVTFGDTYARRNMNVAAEGQNKLTNINTNANQYLSRSFNVNVNDGKLDLRFSVGNGGDVWSITRIWLRKVGTNGAKSLAEEDQIALDDTLLNNALAVYPNPVSANGIITINGATIGTPITIHNSIGQEVHRIIAASENQEISLAGRLSKGLYFINTNNGAIKLKLLIK